MNFLIFPFPSALLTYSNRLVVLVAKHFTVGDFLCSLHLGKLYHFTLFRKGEEVNLKGGREKSHTLFFVFFW